MFTSSNIKESGTYYLYDIYFDCFLCNNVSFPYISVPSLSFIDEVEELMLVDDIDLYNRIDHNCVALQGAFINSAVNFTNHMYVYYLAFCVKFNHYRGINNRAGIPVATERVTWVPVDSDIHWSGVYSPDWWFDLLESKMWYRT